MRIPFSRLDPTEDTWIDLGNGFEVYVRRGEPERLCYPWEGKEEGLFRLETWAGHGYLLGTVELACPDEERRILCCARPTPPEAERLAAEEAGRQVAESWGREHPGLIHGPYPGKTDFIGGLASLGVTPFEDPTPEEKAMARELAHVSQRAAEAHWNQLRAEGWGDLNRLDGLITDLMGEALVLSPALANKVGEQAQRLLTLEAALRDRGGRPTT